MTALSQDISDFSPLLSASGVRKCYRRGGQEIQVLNEAEVAVVPGEVVILAGPSGSGKSTLLAILGCLLTPEAGRLSIDGEHPFEMSEAGRADLRSQKIGYIFQRCHLIQGLTALENVMMANLLLGVSAAESESIAKEKLIAVNLGQHLDSHASQMSLGQCQRVAVARALATDPRIILADEPTASLDHKNGEEVISLISSIGRTPSRAAVIVTHDQRIFKYADRILWVENGRVKAKSPAAEVCL